MAFCLVFAGMILSFLKFRQLAFLVHSISLGESERVCVRTEIEIVFLCFAY